LNNVIRALFLELHRTYGVAEVLGFRGGYQGLDPTRGPEPMVITPAFVDHIHQHGGTILGTSRGPVDTAAVVDKPVLTPGNQRTVLGDACVIPVADGVL
jgi:6-phosphofructokinase 1